MVDTFESVNYGDGVIEVRQTIRSPLRSPTFGMIATAKAMAKDVE
jgi:hypothetical protein